MMSTQIIGKPNPQAVARLFDAFGQWIADGSKCCTCRECFATLSTPEELAAEFCTAHLLSRKAFDVSQIKPKRGAASKQAEGAA